jgi:hypothetical protein|tara:strand:- start:1921 stop:2586 length:666 start_codon:yes stop_codon:yes gene_type:complete
MKTNLLKISIILSVLTIIYLILSYSGIIRYISLHCKETLNLAEKYGNKTKSQHFKNNKTIVTMFSNDLFKENLKPVINSILDQSVKVDSILLFTSQETENKYLPEHIKYAVNVIKNEVNYGYGNNIIPAIFKEKEEGVIIIPIENKIYGEDYIETLLDKSVEKQLSQIFNQNNDLVLIKIDNLDNKFLEKNNKEYSKDWFFKNILNKNKIEYNDIKKCLFT